MNKKKIFVFLVLLLFIPAIVILGATVFREKNYAFVSLAVALLSCAPVLYSFEKRENTGTEITTLAILTAVSVTGRFVFAFLPGIKPVTAITVISALYLGGEYGFVIGSLSAVISNFYFGQGPWTPFQMLSWGLIGLLAGCLSKPLKKNKFLLCLFSGAAGIVYSMTMDIWTVIWADNTFNVSRYLAAVITSLPTMAGYVISNIIFVIILSKPIGEKLERIKNKYGLFNTH